MNGKGDNRRPEDTDSFNDNWDRIFGKSKMDEVDTTDVEPFHIKNARELKMQDLEYKEKLAEEKRRKHQEFMNQLEEEIENDNED